ncbi:MAG: glycosyltransferase, partial [Candidatus Eisenbacteria bacterium]|nr:glycosyltransferase [Candidatus Eisenbacteria bacterium]
MPAATARRDSGPRAPRANPATPLGAPSWVGVGSEGRSRLPSPAISIVLPVLNEARDIGRLLGELRDQESPPGGFEVLVADGGSTDRTREIVQEWAADWPALRLLENPDRLSSAGRNVGARAARGRYVMFLDGHCALPRRDYVKRAVALFQSTGADCLCRPQPLDRLTDSPWARAISAARHSRLGHNPGSDIYGGTPGFTDPRSAGAAYTRACFEQLGGYDQRFDACEDVEFNHRVAEAGFRAYRHPDLAVAYRPRASLRGLYRQMARYGRGRARLMARHGRLIPWPLVGISVYVLVVLVAAVGLGLAALMGAGPGDPANAPGSGSLALLALALCALPAALWLLLIAGESLRLGGLSAA